MFGSDWSTEKKAIGLEISEEKIQELSKTKFKSLTSKKIESYALVELNQLKMKLDKSDYLQSSSFKTAQYLVDDSFTKTEAHLLFKLRSETLNVKTTFSQMYSDNLCRICKLFPESQFHLLQCPDIIPKLKLLSNYKEIDENYIYGDVSKQLKIVKIYTKVLKIREELLEDLEVLQS